jgi:hypothetical protein
MARAGLSSWLFAAFGGYAALVVLLLTRRRGRVFRTTAVLVVTAIAFSIGWLLWPNVVLRSTQPSLWDRSPWKELLLFLTMLAGMSARYLWELIETRRARNAAREAGEPKHGLDFDWWDFLQPLCISVIVFALVLQGVQDLGPASLLFSFQNGFFWQTVFRKSAGSPGTVGSA